MFNLFAQAAAIVAKLEANLSVETVAYIDEDSQSMRHPATLPAAFVVLEKLSVPDAHNKRMTSIVGWTVVVRSKKLNGTGGVLPIVDAVVDALVGLQPLTGMQPLWLLEIEYYDQQAESVAYAVRFGSKMKNITGSC